ncbi:hypothetical protein M378DRAFT_182604 [Amanita muscaria Koide BX008]|uniref:Uncharacterized protein n=1 Tax=Amanita muscaria (strain Koide BX008) TaxID=946122 RepID=A0A0C2WDZ2_AMAMK|nr:hypothetical protein M378DRAFT_182604 [Amanita muscaria Koide BX008]
MAIRMIDRWEHSEEEKSVSALRAHGCVHQERVPPDVNLERIGGPSPSCLDKVQWGAVQGHVRGTSCAKGMATKRGVTECVQVPQEPRASRWTAVLAEPELRVVWELVITAT